MKASYKILSIATFIAAIAVVSFWTIKNRNVENQPSRMLLGWQTAWATAGQVVETINHTNITQISHSSGSFRNFLAAPEMNEAALSGDLDGVNNGVVPTINILAASDDWVVVCRLADFLVATVVRKDLGISKIEDLKGKKLGVPFGAGSHPYAFQLLKDYNLSVGTGSSSVEMINVAPSEHVAAMKQGLVQAVATWEPQIERLCGDGYAIIIDQMSHSGFVTIRRSLLENNRAGVVKLVQSYALAHFYVSQNRAISDAWFAKRSGLDPKILEKLRVIEPNLNAKTFSDIDISISLENVQHAQALADQMAKNGLIRRPIVFTNRCDMSIVRDAMSDRSSLEKLIPAIIVTDK